MGWLYVEIPNGLSVTGYLKDEFSYEDKDRKIEVVDCFMDGYAVAYLAQRHTIKTSGRSVVLAIVCLLDLSSEAEKNDLGYKDMCETDGPGALGPRRILRQLSPLSEFRHVFKEIVPGSMSYRYAEQWRQASWSQINKYAAWRKVNARAA